MRSLNSTGCVVLTIAIILQNFLVSIAAFSTTSSRTLLKGQQSREHSAHFASRQDDNDDSSRQSEEAPHLIFPGGGIFFYWQAGVVCYLREQGYDLSSCTFSGASAGALTATLTAGEVDFYEATDLALGLAAKAGVWDRSGGLQGIWGPMIFEWLDTLLPNSLDNIEGRLSLLVTPIPSFGKTKVSEFADKDDLIRCNMASVHIPWFLDGQLTYPFRESLHIDGSFLSKDEDYLPINRQRPVLCLDWSSDPVVGSKGGLDIVEALSPEGIWGLIDQGKTHAKFLEEKGTFSRLDKVQVLENSLILN